MNLHQTNLFQNYFKVNKNSRFNYWLNQTKEVHFPIYYSILHTICSFLPGKFNKLYTWKYKYFFFLY